MTITFEQIKAHITPFEGNVAHMYLCTEGRVTVGIGNMMPTVVNAQSLPFIDRTTKSRATAEQIKADYEAVAKMLKGQGHAYYKPSTKLDLPDVEINSLFRRRVDQFQRELKEIYADYDTFPDEAQLALLDLIFNLGKGGLRDEWPKLNKAVNEQDWIAAAANCIRPKARPNRNQGTKSLFDAAAAKVARAKSAGTSAGAP